MASPKPFPFLLLPLELRQEVYTVLICDSILATHRPPKPWAGNYTLWPIIPITPTNLGLEITSQKEFLKAFRLESQLIYTSRQIYAEFTAILYAQIHHLRLTGDFLMNISLPASTHILHSLTHRPWLATTLRTLRIQLRVSPCEHDTLTFWQDADLWRRYPVLMSQLLKADAALRATVSGARWQNFWPTIPNMPHRVAAIANEAFVPTSSLAELVRIVDGYPALERVDIDPDAPNVLMLWPNPLDEQKLGCFRNLWARGVTVNLMLRSWEQWLFFAILELAGADPRAAVVWDYDDREIRNMHIFPLSHGGLGAVRYEVFDWLPKSAKVETAEGS